MKSDEIFSFSKKKKQPKNAALITVNQTNFMLLPISVQVGHQVYAFFVAGQQNTK